jgi:hypothetical protein
MTSCASCRPFCRPFAADDNNRVFFEDLGKFLGGGGRPPDVQFLLDGRASHVEVLAARKANIDKRQRELYTPAESPRRPGSSSLARIGSPSKEPKERPPKETREQMLARLTSEVRTDEEAPCARRRRPLARGGGGPLREEEEAPCARRPFARGCTLREDALPADRSSAPFDTHVGQPSYSSLPSPTYRLPIADPSPTHAPCAVCAHAGGRGHAGSE